MWCLKSLCLVLLFSFGLSSNTRPNIIVIVADDMGWNDVGFHGSAEIPTPNIDALAYNGVILNGHYTQALCTPSRSAFLTGKYPIHLGMQHIVILEPEPWGLGLNETLLPQRLKQYGYATHAIGKWHLGFFKKEYTPTYRGFDTHFGYWQGLQDYYEHTVHSTFTSEVGYDMRRNMSVDWDAKGKYSTTLFTEEAVKLIHEHDTSNPMFMYLAHLAPHTGNSENPLQAPDEEIAKFAHIADPERRIYAAMVSMLDKSVGKVMSALREKHMLENSIILFMADNGAQSEGTHANHGSNYPLRGMKYSPWEGGMRCVAAVWSPLIKKPQRVSNHVMHISDWLPTFYSAAGLNSSELGNIDGLDMWKTISENATSPRTELVYNIDDIDNYYAVRRGDWKYIYGTTSGGKKDTWYGSSGEDGDYTYDEDAVLKSQTASALAGVITSQQILEKHMNIKDHKQNETDFTIQLLSPEAVLNLREAATLRCPETNDEHLRELYQCKPLESPCLFNLKEDPCERINLARSRPVILESLEDMLMKMKKTAIAPRNVPRDPKADPALWNNTWTNWQDCEEVEKRKLDHEFWSPLAIGLVTTACVVFLIVIIVLVITSMKKSKSPKMMPVFTNYEDPMDMASTEMKPKFRDQAFEDRETAAHHSYRDALKSIE